MKKNNIIVCLVLVVAILAAVCLLPWPTTVATTFHGVQVSTDGTVLREGDITFTATKNHYLIKDDTYKEIAVSLPGHDFDTATADYDIPIVYPTGYSFEYITFSSYETEFAVVSILMDSDQDWCVVMSGGEYFVGSVEEDFDVQEILDICGEFLRLD